MVCAHIAQHGKQVLVTRLASLQLTPLVLKITLVL